MVGMPPEAECEHNMFVTNGGPDESLLYHYHDCRGSRVTKKRNRQ